MPFIVNMHFREVMLSTTRAHLIGCHHMQGLHLLYTLDLQSKLTSRMLHLVLAQLGGHGTGKSEQGGICRNNYPALKVAKLFIRVLGLEESNGGKEHRNIRCSTNKKLNGRTSLLDMGNFYSIRARRLRRKAEKKQVEGNKGANQVRKDTKISFSRQ